MEDSNQQGQSNLNVPPPPKTEVVVRTMKSDTERLGLSGGHAPTGEKVAVSMPEEEAGESQSTAAKRGGGKKILLWTIVGLVGVAALFAIGFFVIPALL